MALTFGRKYATVIDMRTAEAPELDRLPFADEHPTISVPEAGRLGFGLSQSASYDAVRRGLIPVIRNGAGLRVPVAELRRKLGLEPTRPLAS